MEKKLQERFTRFSFACLINEKELTFPLSCCGGLIARFVRLSCPADHWNRKKHSEISVCCYYANVMIALGVENAQQLRSTEKRWKIKFEQRRVKSHEHTRKRRFWCLGDWENENDFRGFLSLQSKWTLGVCMAIQFSADDIQTYTSEHASSTCINKKNTERTWKSLLITSESFWYQNIRGIVSFF